MPESDSFTPISKATEEEVLALLTAEAKRLERIKAEARIAAVAAGASDEEVETLLPLHPAGTFAV